MRPLIVDKVKVNQFKGRLLIGLTLAILLPASFAFAQPKQKSLAVFPVGLGESAFSPEGYSLETASTKPLEDEFKKDNRFSVVPFSRAHPSIRRALAEGFVTAQMLMAPFTGRSQGEFNAIRLGRLMRVDLAVASIIDSYDFNAATGAAKMVVRFELFDVKASKFLGSVALTAEGKGADEKTAAGAAINHFLSVGVPQSIEILTKPPKPGGT